MSEGNVSDSSHNEKRPGASSGKKNCLDYVCENCGETFQNMAAILSHNKWKHENAKISVHVCSVCQTTFSTKSNLDRHNKNAHSKPEDITKKKTFCFFCDFSAPNRESVLRHYELNHEVHIVKKTLNFDTFEEFKMWKQSFEKETKSYFIKRSSYRQVHGKKSVSSRENDVVLVTKFICHRDGCFRSRSKGIRRLKLVGSNKINVHCPANIVTYEKDQTVKVVYMDTHVGHELDLGHLNLSECERAEIARKLAMKRPFETILDGIRDSIVNTKLDRIHLVTRKDLWNIADSYKLNRDAILNKNDKLNVAAWVERMQKSTELVRFYKPQGVLLEDFPMLEKEDFFLIIMNDAQKEILQTFGNDCVCIDGIYGLNANDFQLYTIMVSDDLRQGFPCSFLLSSRGDDIAMQIYFRTVNNCLHDSPIHPRTFMSDVDGTFYNAWAGVVGPVENQLFCSWHVDRAWRKNLSKIKKKEKQAAVYKKLKLIMYELDFEEFNVMINNFVNELHADIDCLEFSEYFEVHFMKKKKSWAYCYRRQCGINTNMNLENMHRILKHIYFRGKNVKRLDETIMTLMKYIRDKLYDRLIVLNKGKISTKLVSIRKHHKKSVEVELNSTIIEMGNCWNVFATNSDDTCTVEALDSTCICNLRCQDCGACIHRYTCTCIDFSIKWNMCKHIHLVCMFLKRNAITVEVDGDGDRKNAILSVLGGDEKRSLDERKRYLAEKLVRWCRTIDNEEQFEAVRKQVAPVQSIIIAHSINNNNKDIPKCSKEQPNKKIKKRIRFSSTKKKKKTNRKTFTNASNKGKAKLAVKGLESEN